ncbi:MAG TPA: hypothetical protein VKG38_04185 [Solirubrobacteraceae bacterium]|nr:hypothetical protein [Solirubrobacteraceae bacterium]
MSKRRRQTTTTNPPDDARTPVLDTDGTVASWIPGQRERDAFETRLAATIIDPADYIDPSALELGALYNYPWAKLRGQALLDWFTANEPESVLSESDARFYALRGDNRDWRES